MHRFNQWAAATRHGTCFASDLDAVSGSGSGAGSGMAAIFCPSQSQQPAIRGAAAGRQRIKRDFEWA